MMTVAYLPAPGEELEIRWCFQAGRRTPAFVARLQLGDLVWIKIGDYRRRTRVVKVSRGKQVEGPYTEVCLRFTEGDAR